MEFAADRTTLSVFHPVRQRDQLVGLREAYHSNCANLTPMKVQIKITNAGTTSLRNARRFVSRGTARWVGSGETEIAMISGDHRVNNRKSAGVSRQSVGLQVLNYSGVLNDPGKDMPALSIIGYDRRSLA